jgi:hypothetical protein
MTIRCFYKCRCMAQQVAVDVQERTEDQDVVDWVENTVGHAIGADHRARSPFCMATVMEFAKIPAPENAPFIGGAPKLDS